MSLYTGKGNIGPALRATDFVKFKAYLADFRTTCSEKRPFDHRSGVEFIYLPDGGLALKVDNSLSNAVLITAAQCAPGGAVCRSLASDRAIS